MVDLSLLVERVVAGMYLIIGVSLLVQRKAWLNWISDFYKDNGPFPWIWFFALPFSLTIVLTHNTWSWHPSVFVTFVGWAGLIKTIIFLLAPKALAKLMPKPELLSKILVVDGVVVVLLSGWVLWAACGCH